MKTQIAEILIQCDGATAGTPDHPTWHIGVNDVAESMDDVAKLGGSKRYRVLSMAQCEAEGVKLPAMFEQVARSMMKRAETAEKAHRDALDKHEELSGLVDSAASAVATAVAERDAAIVKRAELEARLVAPKKSLASQLTFGLIK